MQHPADKKTTAPDPGIRPTDAQQAVWIALQRAAPRLQDRVDERLKAAHLPDLADYSVLWAIERAGGSVRPRDLGVLLFLRRYQVSRRVDDLVRQGLVVKSQCADDARGHLLSLTDCGRAMRHRIWAIYGPAMAEAISPLSEAEALTLANLLSRLEPSKA
jgi:DNA-binding MarR family transcriptional regulator